MIPIILCLYYVIADMIEITIKIFFDQRRLVESIQSDLYNNDLKDAFKKYFKGNINTTVLGHEILFDSEKAWANFRVLVDIRGAAQIFHKDDWSYYFYNNEISENEYNFYQGLNISSQ